MYNLSPLLKRAQALILNGTLIAELWTLLENEFGHLTHPERDVIMNMYAQERMLQVYLSSRAPSNENF